MKITNNGRGIHQREVPGLEKLKSLPEHWHAFTNLDIALPGRGIREIDMVIVIDDRLLLVDLKDWIGPIASKDGNWFNGKRDCGRSPVRKINENVRDLTPILRHFLSSQDKREKGVKRKLPVPWIEGVVVLTRTTDRSGVSASEVSHVFSVVPFMKMLRNPAERDAQLGSRSKNVDFTTPEWITRFRRLFNTSGGIFQPGIRRYGGFKATSGSPTFAHRDGIFSEFDVEEEDVRMSSGLLRRWDFTKADTRFQTEEGRGSIVGREKLVIAWLDDRNPNCGAVLLKPRIDDHDRGVDYWEVFERRRRMKRLRDFNATDLHRATSGERLELARQILASAKLLHDVEAAHLDIGLHSIWVEPPTTVKFSHLMAASFPEIHSLGKHRFQFLSSSKVPEDVLQCPATSFRKDVFLLGCAVHSLLFGTIPAGDPPEWTDAVDPDGAHSLLHPWFERVLDLDPRARFGGASEMLDAFNAALASIPSRKSTIEGLAQFNTLKSQRQVFQLYPESKLIHEDDRVLIWLCSSEGSLRIVKMWKGTALGDTSREAPRILSFLERAQAIIESPIPGIATLNAAHWTGDAIVLVQDFVDGCVLSRELTAGGGPFSTSEHALTFLLDLVDTIESLHDRSIAHGDLKPANIIVVPAPNGSNSVPVLIDVLDFSPSQDGDRLSRAYAPPSGGRFERDRFAITKIVEEILGARSFSPEISTNMERAVAQCRLGPPTNATLLPLREALERAIQPARLSGAADLIRVSIIGARNGPMLPDEGEYWISRFGSKVNIRGATEKLEIRVDSNDIPVMGRRVPLTQSAIQRVKRYELASFGGEIVVESTTSDFNPILTILQRPEIAHAWSKSEGADSEKADEGDGDERGLGSTEEKNDEIGERLAEAPHMLSTIDVRSLWRTMVKLEAELTIEAATLGDSFFRQKTKRHIVPIQMMAGELDFDRNDTVLVERQDQKGRWMRVGFLDIFASTTDFLAVDSWLDAARGPVVTDGSRLRFQSRYENVSWERREQATRRILRGAAAAPKLFEAFEPCKCAVPRRVSRNLQDEAIATRYGLNPVQIEALKTILECRPVGLLQGPPGTGKTRFIGALVHYALTHGLARNVLLASQSHEAVNNAGEAVLDLFGDDRDVLSLIRVGHEGSISDSLKPYHVARVERAYKDQFSATTKMRLEVVAKTLGLRKESSLKVLHFEQAGRPVLAKICDLTQSQDDERERIESLKRTVERIVANQGIDFDWHGIDLADAEYEFTNWFHSTFPVDEREKIEKYSHVVQLSQDIVGTVSTWQRSFETFLAGTRQVVIGTCVGLGRTSLGLTKTVFDLVIVDEAARCTPSELAVPIQAGKWVVLVGDHAQLEPQHSPEVVENVAEDLHIPLHEIVRSDFERVFESSYGRAAGATLTKQYRMLAPIGRVVSNAFYDRSLQHGRSTSIVDRTALPPDLSKPLVWISTDSFGEKAYQKCDHLRKGSLVNQVEADVIIKLLKRWSAHEPFVEWLTNRLSESPSIGIICAYSAQRDLVWKKIQAENLPDAMRRSMKVDTIDSYQGKENPIVLLSLVRNNADGSMEGGSTTIAPGFMSRSNRVNVAVSRAMDRLIIVGAKVRWRRSSPLGKVAKYFGEEMKSNEAVLLDAKGILKASKTTKGARPTTDPIRQRGSKR